MTTSSSNSSFHILVVEDDKSTQEMLCQMLGLLGHHPHCVSSAEEADEPLKTRHFDILFADIQLPGMSGIDFAEIAVKTTPGIKVIFASGFNYLVTDKTSFKFTLLPKPYGLDQLQNAIEAVCPPVM
ncbi:MAG TPA: response regulator [Noviherbaspirillum sp.]|jgi:CheY-like chemotaxis protein|uniref:response regulator n=1 Tax=Noviherbaspirillum sp. TaxID=1926288 RepID=UPI002DDD1FE7|nr:response regulator [Noviherbaspirillum sp.]HEV2610815.1 response regulator [Noviherbaspirillum sp.]